MEAGDLARVVVPRPQLMGNAKMATINNFDNIFGALETTGLKLLRALRALGLHCTMDAQKRLIVRRTGQTRIIHSNRACHCLLRARPHAVPSVRLYCPVPLH